MKLYIPLLSSVIILASCSTSYKSGQTPDDVYFSPERQRDEYARVEKKDDRSYENNEVAREDRYLRMKTQYRRYSTLDNCDCYSYAPNNYYSYNDYHRYNSYNNFNNNWYSNSNWGYYNPYYYNPYYSNPYYSGYVAGNVRPIYNKPRTSNLNAYNNNTNTNNSTYTNTPRKGSASGTSSSATDNYRGSGNNAGGFLRNVFNSGSNNSTPSTNSSSNNNSSSTPTPPASSSSSSGSSSAPVRKF